MYFVTAVCLLYTQWGGLSSNAPAFKTSVAEGLKQVICGEFPGPTQLSEAQALTIDQVNDIPFALDYIGRYLQCAKSNTGFLGLPDPTALWAGEFARISFIHLKVDTEGACRERGSMISNSSELECHNNTADALKQLSPMWEVSPKEDDDFAMVAILKKPGETLDDLQKRLDKLNETDRAFIDRFALGIKLQMVAFDRLGHDGAYFSFEVRFGGQDDKMVKQIASSTIRSTPSFQHYFWGVAFMLGNLLFFFNELQVWRLTYLQVSCWLCISGRE